MKMPRFACLHCGEECFDSFWLRDEVWRPIAPSKGVLHFECVEARLGRPLALADFDMTKPAWNREIAQGVLLVLTELGISTDLVLPPKHR